MLWARRLLPLLLGGSLLTAGLARAGDPPPVPPAAPSAAGLAAFEKEVRPFLSMWCASCHGGEKPEAGFDVAALKAEPADVAAFARMVELRQRIVAGEMPPVGSERAKADETQRFLQALDAVLVAGDAALPADPGRVTVRRLSRFEFARTVKDLLGVDFDPGASFPADDLAYGFDNVSARSEISTAASRYFSSRSGETESTSPTVSKP